MINRKRTRVYAHIHNQPGSCLGPVIAFDYMLQIEPFAFTPARHGTEESSLRLWMVLAELKYRV
jgi:hypothetical protein